MSLSSRTVPVLSVLLVFLVNGLHGQTIFSFQAVASQSEDVGSIEVCIGVAAPGSTPVDTTLNVSTIAGLTTAGPDDFSPQNATLFFTQADIIAQNAQCFTVNITDDMVVELNEDVAYEVIATDPSNVVVNNDEEFTITDNDVAIISFGNETAISVLESVGTIPVCVNLTGPSGGLERDLTITVGDREGTAEKPQDYVITPSDPLQVMFTSGTPQGGLACGIVQIESEDEVDADKDFQMFLDPVAITAAIVVEPMVINITILNDDNATLTIRDLPQLVNEGSDLQICVELNESPATDILVDLVIADATMLWPPPFSNADISRPLNQISFVAGQRESCDTIQIVSDELLEGPENFTVRIMSSDPPLMFGDPVFSTIMDGDSANVSFVMAQDSTSEDSNMVSVCVELIDLPANGSAVSVEVDFTPAMNGIGRCNPHSYARLPEDYTLPGPITFPPAVMMAPPNQCVIVTIIDDTFAEDNETIHLAISSVEPSTNVGVNGITTTAVTIIDNDVVNFTLPEALTTLENSTDLALFVSILGPATNLERSINVTIVGTNDSALSPDDFSIPMPVLMFECSENITITNETGKETLITIVDDRLLEGDEMFSLSISTTPTDNVNIINGNTTVTIEDDDFSAGFDQTDFTFSEGAGQQDFEFRVFQGVPRRETIFSVTSSSDLPNLDFLIITQTVILGPTTTNATVTVLLVDDGETEQDESFQVTVNTTDASAILINNTLDITIDSNDMSEVFLSNMIATNVTEGGDAVACVAVTGFLRTNLTVNVSLTDITAELTQDYNIPDGSLTFVIVPPSTETCQVVADTTADDRFEDFETFQVSINSVDFEDVTIGSPSSQNVTIINTNELSITIQPTIDPIAENGGMTEIVATANSVPAMGSSIPIPIQLSFATSNATLDTDFTISGDEFVFMVADLVVQGSQRTISVNATDDEILEGDELITFELVPSDILDLPGLTVTILDENITITDDEVIRIEFTDALYNFTEGDTSVSVVCIRPESVPAAGFSVPIVTSVSVGSLDNNECTGSGLASAFDFEIDNDLMFTFPANSTTEQCLSLNITNDTLTEGLETFTLTVTVISPPMIATAGPPSTVRIFDNDTITVSTSESIVQVFENVTNATVCVDLDEGRVCTITDVNVDSFVPMFNMATADEDYVSGRFTAVFPVNSTSGATACFIVTIIDDMVVEGDENFGLRLAVEDNPLVVEASMIADTQTRVDIINNDAAVRFANDSLIVNEAQDVFLCVEIFDGQLLESASVGIQVNRTQGAGSLDFMLSTTTLVFGPIVTRSCFTVSITADVLKEVNESIALRIVEDGPTIVASPDLLNITIVSNDVANVSFVNSTLIEVDESIGSIQLCVELNGAAISQELSISFDPVWLGLTGATANTDFMVLASQQSFSFPANSPVGSISCINITIEDDQRYELTERFAFQLTPPDNPLCVISDPTRVDVDIVDNDDITLSFNTSSVDITEGEDATIQVILETPPGGIEPTVTVTIMLDNTTTETGDFSFSPSMVIFDGMVMPPMAVREIELSALLDMFVEQDIEVAELSFTASSRFNFGNFSNLTVNILNINGGNLTILQPPQTNESAGSVNISVELSLDSGITLEDPFNVTIAFGDSTATANLDFTPPVDNVLTFEPGLTLVETVSVQLLEDQLFEEDTETFTATIMNPTISALSIPVPTVNIDILDSDIASFSISPTSVRVLEDAGSTDICINLFGPANGLAVDVPVNYTIVNGSATLGDDFNASPGTVTFFAGDGPSSTRCISIDILEDVLFEGEESFTFEASVTEPRAVVNPSVSNITIIDNELRVEYLNESIAREFPEGDVPMFPICFSVVEGIPSIDHDILLVPDPLSTATEGTDYILFGNPLIINSTVTSGCIEVIILDDNISENDDIVSFTANTTSPGLQFSNGGSLNLTIINDDFPILEFNNTKYIVNESITDVEICIRVNPDGARIGPDHLPLEVQLDSEDKTAQKDSDFTVSSHPITFTNTSQSVSCENRVSIVDDNLTEITESFILSFNHPIGGSDEVEVVIHDPDVCPNAEQGQVCEDHVFLRICNTLRLKNNGVIPRSCGTVLAEYGNISYQPNGADSAMGPIAP